MSGVRMLHFLNDCWKFIQIHQYYNYDFKGWKYQHKKLPQPQQSFGYNNIPISLIYQQEKKNYNTERLKGSWCMKN